MALLVYTECFKGVTYHFLQRQYHFMFYLRVLISSYLTLLSNSLTNNRCQVILPHGINLYFPNGY